MSNVFNFKEFKIQTFRDSISETFVVKTSDVSLKRRLKSLKTGDILFIKGNYYFNVIYPDTLIKLVHFNNISQAQIYLLNEKMSQDLYIKGQKAGDTIKTHIPIDTPITEKLKTNDVLKADSIGNENYYRGYIKNNTFLPLL